MIPAGPGMRAGTLVVLHLGAWAQGEIDAKVVLTVRGSAACGDPHLTGGCDTACIAAVRHESYYVLGDIE